MSTSSSTRTSSRIRLDDVARQLKTFGKRSKAKTLLESLERLGEINAIIASDAELMEMIVDEFRSRLDQLKKVIRRRNVNGKPSTARDVADMDAVLEQLREYQKKLRDCEDEVTSARVTIDGHVGSLHAAESAMNEHKAKFLSATEELARLEQQLLINSSMGTSGTGRLSRKQVDLIFGNSQGFAQVIGEMVDARQRYMLLRIELLRETGQPDPTRAENLRGLAKVEDLYEKARSGVTQAAAIYGVDLAQLPIFQEDHDSPDEVSALDNLLRWRSELQHLRDMRDAAIQTEFGRRLSTLSDGLSDTASVIENIIDTAERLSDAGSISGNIASSIVDAASDIASETEDLSGNDVPDFVAAAVAAVVSAAAPPGWPAGRPWTPNSWPPIPKELSSLYFSPDSGTNRIFDDVSCSKLPIDACPFYAKCTPVRPGVNRNLDGKKAKCLVKKEFINKYPKKLTYA